MCIRDSPNVVGLGVGVKWRNGEPTGEPALVTLVSRKLAKDELREADLVQPTLANMQTDVLEVGYLFAQVGELRQQQPSQLRTEIVQPSDGLLTGGYRVSETIEPLEKPTIELLARRTRPAEGGFSVGHFRITAGTIATCVYDILPGGSINPPTHGEGIPSRYYILSNNHILANSNDANIGDRILQPGPFDGGADPSDRIAHLSRFIPIEFEPPIPRAQHNNLVDAAIAEGQFHELDREIHWIGCVRGWRRKRNVRVGTRVYKTGRTTNFTSGRITAIGATVDVNFGGGRVARFRDQIVTTNISAGGDSGSLVVTLENSIPVAVGLLFAGSSFATIVNQIENVRSLLRVEVAEQIL
ncbi:MAG: S1 family peptidase, partial [Fischerella sp.]|nr:S1 family peptidase [Fischerella sp.]